MALETQSYTVSRVTTVGDNSQNIFTHTLADGEVRTYKIFTLGTTAFASPKMTRQWVMFTVYNDAGTITFIDSPVIDLIPPYEDPGFASSPSYAYSSTGATLTFDVSGPSDEELIQWKADIEWTTITMI